MAGRVVTQLYVELRELARLLHYSNSRSLISYMFGIRLKATDWGELDVLILDLPPGTGDVQLAVCQELQLSGAVAGM